VDPEQIRAAGIRTLRGQRLTLHTDLPSDPEIDRLPEIFDAAYEQWHRYFGAQPNEQPPWRMTGCLIKDRKRFVEAGLIPDDLPDFRHGFATSRDLWLYEQPTDYYRRHLLLHEGTHGYMSSVFGSCGPPWYSEAVAELMSTHRLSEDGLQLAGFPQRREDVPMLGRIKLLQDARQEDRMITLADVRQFTPRSFRQNDGYAWCWATAAFLDGHPRYQKRFRNLHREVDSRDFPQRFRRTFATDWLEMQEEWSLFVNDLEHGHDLARTQIDFRSGEPLRGEQTVTVQADAGWQNSGIALKRGKPYRLHASGRFQIADQPNIWWSEPGGVSIRYYRGMPLGILLACLRPDRPETPSAKHFLHPQVIGLQGTFTPSVDGTLYLRINDSAGELHDNAGSLRVVVDEP
jgi:hypothetical protein